MTQAIEVIKRALRILRVYAKEQPLQASDQQIAIEALNDMVTYWQTQYGHLWLYQEAVVILEDGKQRYDLGSDRVATYDDLNSTTVASDTTTVALEVSAAGTIAVSDVIGVELDTGAIHWTTVSAISGVNVTLAAAPPSKASAGNQVFAYTSVIDRPLRVTQARYAWKYGESEAPLDLWSRDEYFEQPMKSNSGIVSAYYYSPQRTNGHLYVWPTASSNTSVLFITCVRPFILTMDNADNVDLPDEWATTLAYNLAVELMDEYGTPLDRQQAIKQKADERLANNLSFDNPTNGMSLEFDRD